MKRLILQSSMNYQYTDTKYSIGLAYLEKCHHDKWIKISDIPDSIKYEVIDLLDRGFNPYLKSIFNEDYTAFLISSIPNIEKVAINCKTYWTPKIKLPYYS